VKYKSTVKLLRSPPNFLKLIVRREVKSKSSRKTLTLKSWELEALILSSSRFSEEPLTPEDTQLRLVKTTKLSTAKGFCYTVLLVQVKPLSLVK
jgi:hypothetical protein